MHAYIDRTGLPEEDRSAARAIEENLWFMEGAVREFLHTVDLYLYAHNRKQQVRRRLNRYESVSMQCWMAIAGRNGAILIQGIADVMEDTSSIQAPVLWSRVNIPRRKRAFNRISEEFPDIRAIRDSAAHPGELTATPQEEQKHLVKGGGIVFRQAMLSAFDDRLIYGGTLNGKHVEYELSMRKARMLEDIVIEFTMSIAHPDVQLPRAEGLSQIGGQQQQDQTDRPQAFDNPDAR